MGAWVRIKVDKYFLCFKPLSRIPYGYLLIYTVLWNYNMHVYVFLFQPILCSVTFLRFNAHACMYMYMSTMSCLSTWRNCARIRIYACRSRLERPMIAEVKVLQLQNVVYVHFMCMLPYWLFKWKYGQHRCGYTFIPTGNRFSAL